MSKRILLTGGRAPAAMELARLFAQQGHMVYLAESVRFPVTRFSNSISKYIHIPAARFRPHEYGAVLADVLEKEQIDVFIPTCEEIFYVSKAIEKFPPQCTVWADTFEKLDTLHNKWTFIEYARTAGFKVPVTKHISSRDELHSILSDSFAEKCVIKPAYSRFASQTFIWNKGISVPKTIQPSATQPWIVQQFIEGTHLCTYSLALKGRLLAHSIYPSQQQWGIGSSTVFEFVDHPVAEKWVERFVAEASFTGQIGFDFIESSDGTLYPIECNPRSTSGTHLFNKTPELVTRFLSEQNNGIVVPQSRELRSIKLALMVRLVRLILNLRPVGEWKKTLHFLQRSSDVLYEHRDPWPVLGQMLSLLEFLLQSAWLGISPTEVATHDSGYNGINESTEAA